jgi:hypothetical protein
MTNREKVLLGLSAAAAIGAAVSYAVPWSGTNASSPQVERTDFSALIAQVQVTLRQGELTDREEHALEAAVTQWLRDPLRPRPLVSSGSGMSEDIPLPTYMGFINTGPRPTAIIDGRDYKSGESVRGGEFQVAGIYPDRVELLRRGASVPVQVPLETPQVRGGSR